LTLLLIALAVIVAVSLAIVFLLALMSAANRTAESDREAGVLATLAAVRSPSGRPFFASPESVQDFVETLDESREETLVER
jgi:hypothetical protein